MPIIITRFANIYGPGQLNFTALIPDCILGNLSLRKFIPRSNGKNKRDFLFVNDVCNLYAYVFPIICIKIKTLKVKYLMQVLNTDILLIL